MYTVYIIVRVTREIGLGLSVRRPHWGVTSRIIYVREDLLFRWFRNKYSTRVLAFYITTFIRTYTGQGINFSHDNGFRTNTHTRACTHIFSRAHCMGKIRCYQFDVELFRNCISLKILFEKA